LKHSKRRHNIGFGYIGFGNKTWAFNQKSKTPFSKLKSHLNSESNKQFKYDFKIDKLSEIEKLQIKNKIRRQTKHQNNIAIATTIVLLIIITICCIKMLEGVLFK